MKIMFVPYRHLSLLILCSFLVIVTSIVLYSGIMMVQKKGPTIFTMSSTIRTYKSLNLDTDGNGRKDTINIEINEERKEYRIEIINDNNKKFILMSEPKVQTIGPYLPWWPLQITVADINMDKIPEIITQVSKSNYTHPLYIFRWNGKEYVKILSGTFEGISIADITGDGVPEVISEEKLQGTGELYTVHSWFVNSYNRIDYKIDTSVRGYDKIQAIIKLIDTPFEEKFNASENLGQYFTEDWLNNIKNIEYLNSFCKEIVGIQLQDYIGEDLKWDGKEYPLLSRWKLRYIVFRKFGSSIKAENYIAEIETMRVDPSSKNYKIKSIKFQGL